MGKKQKTGPTRLFKNVRAGNRTLHGRPSPAHIPDTGMDCPARYSKFAYVYTIPAPHGFHNNPNFLKNQEEFLSKLFLNAVKKQEIVFLQPFFSSWSRPEPKTHEKFPGIVLITYLCGARTENPPDLFVQSSQ